MSDFFFKKEHRNYFVRIENVLKKLNGKVNWLKINLQSQLVRISPLVIKLLVDPQDSRRFSDCEISSGVAGQNRETKSTVFADIAIDGGSV